MIALSLEYRRSKGTQRRWWTGIHRTLIAESTFSLSGIVQSVVFRIIVLCLVDFEISLLLRTHRKPLKLQSSVLSTALTTGRQHVNGYYKINGNCLWLGSSVTIYKTFESRNLTNHRYLRTARRAQRPDNSVLPEIQLGSHRFPQSSARGACANKRQREIKRTQNGKYNTTYEVISIFLTNFWRRNHIVGTARQSNCLPRSQLAVTCGFKATTAISSLVKFP